MAGDHGYHILYLARNHQAWICPERVGRQMPNDPLDMPTPNHFLTRPAANDYIRRRQWKDGLAHRVEACTWDKAGGCLRLHLPEWLEDQDPESVDRWGLARRAQSSARSERRKQREGDRRARFLEAVDVEVKRRLAQLDAA